MPGLIRAEPVQGERRESLDAMTCPPAVDIILALNPSTVGAG